MTLLDFFAYRRRGSAAKSSGTSAPRRFQPRVEMLEARDCPAVAPGGLQWTAVSATQVQLMWNKGAGDLGYVIEQQNGTKIDTVATLGPNATSFTIGPLSASSSATFRVEGFDNQGAAFTAWVAVTPFQAAVTATSPTQVQVSWNAVLGGTGYDVYQWDGTTRQLVGSTSASGTSLTVDQLAANQEYYFEVKANTPSGGTITPWVMVTTPREPIAAPANVQIAAATFTQMTLTWSPAAGATSYAIFEHVGLPTSTQWNAIGTTNAGTTTFVAPNLTPGTVYYFQVEANNASNSAISAVATGITQSPAVASPGNVKAVAVNNSSIQLSWSSAAGATQYDVYRWDGISATSTLIANVPAGTTTYQDTHLQTGEQYWYFVQGVNAANHANSLWVTATTAGASAPLQPPTQFQVHAAGPSSALLTWNLSAGATGYYVLYYTGSSWEQVATEPQGTRQAIVPDLPTQRAQWFMIVAFTAGNLQTAATAPAFVDL